MKILRILINSNRYQSFLPKDLNIWKTDILKMDCKSKLAKWNEPEIYIQNIKHEPGNFFHLCSGAFVADSSAVEGLRSILEMAGELLPLAHLGSSFFLLNVLECVNCLDNERTTWITGKTTGAKIRIVDYYFNKTQFSESTLFKIPETAMSEILCIEGFKDSEDEFRAQVEAQGLKGLDFEVLWSDQE
jgi:hypothetical protein